MVYLAGKNSDKIHKAFNKHEIENKCISWKDLKKIEKGTIILTEIPGNHGIKNEIKAFAEHAIPVIVLAEKSNDLESCSSVLILPDDISISVLITLVKWILYQKDCTIYLDVFNSFFEGADLLIHDAQYTQQEYDTDKHGWGHSPIEYAIKAARRSQVKRLALFHHDPMRTDTQLDELAKLNCDSRNTGNTKAFFAREGMQVEL